MNCLPAIIDNVMLRGIARCACLIALTLAAYAGVFSADFINFDDPVYVSQNPYVLPGWSGAGWNWAWTAFDASNWHPLTWLSLQTDSQFWGTKATGYHATNLLLHVLNVLLLYAWLRRLPATAGLADIVAFLFAVHPLHVESVAWISERKDVLSSFFGFAALWMYTEYVRRPNLLRYGCFCALFALSLLSKPMWVTLPFQLLLLDVWPLARLQVTRDGSTPETNQRARVLVDKVPLLILSVVSCLVTMQAQHAALQTWEGYPLVARLGTAVVSYSIYLSQTLWPTRLALFYPYPNPPFDMTTVIASLSLLLAITAYGFFRWRRNPAVLIGWFWYLGTLVPVIGIVQVGEQAHADRYCYLPQVGLLISLLSEFHLACGALNQSMRWRWAIQGPLVIVLLFLTRAQVVHWQNSETIWRHTLAVTDRNATAHANLGTVLKSRGRLREALSEFERAAELDPNHPEVQFNLGNVLKDLGRPGQAESQLRAAVKLHPEDPEAHHALGLVLAQLGRLDEAIDELNEAVRLSPADFTGWLNLGAMQINHQNYLEAVQAFSRAAELQPQNVQAWIRLASAEWEAGLLEQSQKHFETSLRLDPGWPRLMDQAARQLVTHPDPTQRNAAAAIQLSRRVCQATRSWQPEYLDTLATAYAEAGQFDKAISTIQKAEHLYKEQGNKQAAANAAEKARSYQIRQNRGLGLNRDQSH